MKRFLLAIIIIAVFLAGLFVVRLISGEDDWICSNGQWIKHGNPSTPIPESPCR